MKVQIEWKEIHCYSAEIEIPDGLSEEERLDWVILNTDEWGLYWREPDYIETDWNSFSVENLK